MHYVQYYTDETNKAMGDRGIVILDGRNNIQTMKKDAIKFNGYRRPKYFAFRIFKGDSILRMCKLGPNSVIEDSVRIVTDVNNYFTTSIINNKKEGSDDFDLKSIKIPNTKEKKW